MNYPTSTLKDMCQLIVDCPHSTPEWTQSGYIVVRNQNIKNGRLDLSNPSYTCKEDFVRRNRRAKPQGGDIIFTREAPMGEVCIVPHGLECCIGQRQVLLRPQKGIDGKYLFYALRSGYVQHQILWNEGTGSTVSNVRIPVLEALKIPRLGVSEPLIGEFLGTLDDKIELNRRMNETLEAMARAIFQNEEVSGVWTERLLGEICTIFDGPHATPKFSENGPIFLGISNLNNGLIDLNNTNHISESDFSIWTRRVTPSPLDIVFSYETRLGQVAIIPKGLNCCLGRRMGLLRFKPGKVHPLVLLRAYMASEFQETIRQRTIHGSTVDRIPLKEMANFPIRVPTGPSMENLGQKLSALWDMIEHNQQESHTLAQTRDLLLPKLMSGEIRVRDAETLVEKAL